MLRLVHIHTEETLHLREDAAALLHRLIMRKLLVGIVNGRSRFKTGRLSRLSSGRLLARRGTQNLLSRLRLRRSRGSHDSRRTRGTGRGS